MENKEQFSSTSKPQAIISQLNSEKHQNYEKFCTNKPDILSLTNGQPLPGGVLEVKNNEANPLEISDDSEDEYSYPLVVLRPLEPSDREPPWDAADLNTKNDKDDCINITKSSTTSSVSEEATTTEYSTDGGFVIDDGDKEVFLHHHDPDFDPNTESTSDTSAVGDKGILQANCDGTDDENESPPAKKQRRGSAEF